METYKQHIQERNLDSEPYTHALRLTNSKRGMKKLKGKTVFVLINFALMEKEFEHF